MTIQIARVAAPTSILALAIVLMAGGGCASRSSDNATAGDSRAPATSTTGSVEPDSTSSPSTDASHGSASTPIVPTLPGPLTVGPSTTVTPQTTPAPTTTGAPTTVPRLTIPVDSPEQLRTNIEWDLNVGESALMTAGTDPSNPVLRAELARYFADDPLARLTEFLDGIVRDGLLVRASHDVPNAIRVLRVESASDPLDDATVVACRLDAAVVYEAVVYAPIGETEAIVNDAITVSLTTNTMRLVDDIWQLIDSEGIDHPDILGECGWDGHSLNP